MNKVWDVESEKFIVVDNDGLEIVRKQNIEALNSHKYVNSFKLSLDNTKITKELMDNIAILWNESDKKIAYNAKQIDVEDKCKVKLSVFLDKDKNKYYMKFRLISKDKDGKKNIDYVKLDRQKCRDLYYNLYKASNV